MKILSAIQIRNADSFTIENEPISSIDLMERASEQCTNWINEKFGDYQNIYVFVGPGNNGGDGLAIARLLSGLNNTIKVYILTQPILFSKDCSINYKRLKKTRTVEIEFLNTSNFPVFEPKDLIIDALYGSGLSRPIEGLAAQLIEHINKSNGVKISVDIPSGLFADKNESGLHHIVQANFTLTFQFPKLSFFFAENEKYIGEWVILDISLLPLSYENEYTIYELTDYEYISTQIVKRPVFSHKGTFGHALLIAGSSGKIGAAILASKSVLRTGAGLLTTHLPGCGYSILQSAFPEAMVSVDKNDLEISELPSLDKYDAVGIGPGVGTSENTKNVILQLLEYKIPLVVDADGLNILSTQPSNLDLIPPETILTPHPGEFDRLAGKSENGFERHLKQIEFSRKYNVIVVLKGAFTSITSSNGMCYFNSNGNPGMATAGSGDVLTGIILSLLTQGFKPLDAARTGVFLHGLAGDLAAEKYSQPSLIATDIINELGNAFLKLHTIN